MEDLKFESLHIQIIEENDTIIMNWIGASLNLHPEAKLDPYLNNVINQIQEKKVILNFAKLEIMNSSTVPPILRSIKKLEEANIQTKIFYDSSLSWQTASFRPLSAITKSYKNIEVSPI